MINIFDALLVYDLKNAAWVRPSSVWDRAFNAFLLQIVCVLLLSHSVSLSSAYSRKMRSDSPKIFTSDPIQVKV
jgi:hypothetical protein